MTHYEIAGFGTAANYALALNLEEDRQALDVTVKEMSSGNQYISQLDETMIDIEAKNE